MAKQIYSTDISKKLDFVRKPYTYHNIELNTTAHTGIWEVRNGDRLEGYEVIRGIKHTNPDGKVVYKYPGDEDFGACGWYLRTYVCAMMKYRQLCSESIEVQQ